MDNPFPLWVSIYCLPVFACLDCQALRGKDWFSCLLCFSIIESESWVAAINHELCINGNVVESTHKILSENWHRWELQAVFYRYVNCAVSGRATGFEGRVATGVVTEGRQKKGLHILWSLLLYMSFLSLLCDFKWDGKSVNPLCKVILISDWRSERRQLLSSPL